MPGLVGVWAAAAGRLNVETSPTDVGVVTVPTGIPPVQGVEGSVSVHKVKATDPVGAPPVGLPVTVAVSFHEFPTVVFIGAITVVTSVGVTGQTSPAAADGLCSVQRINSTNAMVAADATLRTTAGRPRSRLTSWSLGPPRPTTRTLPIDCLLPYRRHRTPSIGFPIPSRDCKSFGAAWKMGIRQSRRNPPHWSPSPSS